MNYNGQIARLLILFLLTWLLLASCRERPPADAPQPTATAAASPTTSPTATAVPTPIPTAIPTAGEIDPPRIVRRAPNAIALTSLRPTIRLRFDRPMDQASVAAALVTTPPLPLALSWEDNDLIIQVEGGVWPNQEYSFTLQASAADAAGTPLGADYGWAHRADKLLASVIFPTASRPNLPIALRFNYPVDRESVEASLTFTPPLPGVFNWQEDGRRVSYQPTAVYQPQAVYVMRFDADLRDPAGLTLPAPEEMTFTAPPAILVGQPQGQRVNPLTTVRVTFDRPVDQEKTAAAFAITPAVNGELSWEETTLIFRPEGGVLASNTGYTVAIDATAVAADGEPLLRQPYQWTFRTGVLQPVASFGEGPNVQVVNADGRRAVHFTLFAHRADAVSFELYRLPLALFLERYSSGFSGVAGWQREEISLAGAELFMQWEAETTQSQHEWLNSQEAVIPEEAPPGLYLLNLMAGGLNDQLFLPLTRNGLMVKQAEGELLIWLTRLAGEPVAGAEIGVYARDGRLLDQGQSDENGLYRTVVAQDPQPLIVVARDGEDITVSGLSNEWRQGANPWSGWWQDAPSSRKTAVHIYTDRPIYRPGQTVHFKAIVRQDDDAALALPPEGAAVTARVRDARNNVIQTISLTINHFGTAVGQFEIAAGAGLGQYSVEIVFNNESHRQRFKVEEYHKPDYQVTVTADASHAVDGRMVNFTVEGQYFFGEPVADAAVTIRIYQLGSGYDWSEAYVWYDSYLPVVEGRLDGAGRFAFQHQASLAGSHQGYGSNLRQSTWAVEATVDDGSRQTVSGYAILRVYNVAERISLNSSGYVQTPGVPFTAQVGVNDIEGRPVNGRQMTVSLRRYNPQTRQYDRVVQSAGLTTGADGRAALSMTAADPGYYQLRASGRDRDGREIVYNSWLYIFSPGTFAGSWFGRETGGQLTIATDQDSYAPGDTARLAIESAFSGPALLTFERGRTRREQLIELTAPLTLVDLPILAGDTPNIYVVVSAWQEQETHMPEYAAYSIPDGRLLSAAVNLSVPATDKVLTVTITPDRETYGPRQEATFTLRVTNYRGEPVSAELSLAVVDEAIFALSQELSGPIYDSFYYQRARVVRAYHSLAPVRYLGGGGMGGGGNGGLTGDPRSDFPDTAFWFPILHTDANGEATVTIRLPDSLTSWRLTAKATTADTQVGETYTNVTVRQDIIIRPILPRALTAGDQARLSALVHNYSGERQTLAVSLRALADDYLAVANPLTQTISLAPGELRVVGWDISAVAAGEAQLLAQVWAREMLMDAVRLPLAIRPLAVPDVTTQIGQFSGAFNTTLDLPADALPLSGIRIELSRSIAGTLLEGLDYLTGFPYGCVEQTMSRALPNAVVARAFHQLGIGDPTMQADLPPKINAGLQRLYGFQHTSGGWGWWFDDRTDVYQTAWVLFGLAVTAEAGYEVDAGVIERGAAWLQDNLPGNDPALRAYALYSLAVAGYGDLPATRQLAANAAGMDAFSQAALALALHQLGANAEAREIAGLLAEAAIVSADGRVHWSGANRSGGYDRHSMASDTRSTAIALSALSRVQPNHELIPGAVRWLMGARRQQGWGTTNETAFAVIGLTDHLLATSFSEGAAATGYALFVNGELFAEGSLGRGEPAVSLEIPASLLRAGENSIRMQQSGGGRLYYTMNQRLYLPQAEIEAAGVVGVERAYLDPETNQPLTAIVPGQLVRVQLMVNLPAATSFMIVEDNLPGGLEALNESLNTTSRVASAYYGPPETRWRQLGYNYKEVRADRVSFFITEMAAGRHTLTYMARATHAGTFSALPAEAWAMYDLAVWGRSASAVLSVTALE
jgi:alpha-2-macroglobulin